MSFELIKAVSDKQKKSAVVDVHSGDSVKVHQKIKEGNKERIQIFEGTVIRVDRKNSHTARITVRKIASGVGVEKSFLLHSPLVTKIEVVRRAKVRRNYLSYLRQRSGKATRLTAKNFDKSINDIHDAAAEAAEEEAKEEVKAEAEAKAQEKAQEEAKLEAKQAEVEARHEAEEK